MTMRKKIQVLSAFLAFGLLSGCGSTSRIVATVGQDKISLTDFEDAYAKNNGGWDAGATSTPDDRKRFLDLLVKFRLKLLEAQARDLAHDTAIVNEIESYRASVAQSYVIEKELIEPGVRMLYDRKLEEIRARHILVRVARDAAPADTLAAYRKAMNIIALVGTKPFDSLAVMYSEDPTAQTNGGDLGYFTTGRMVPEFEDAAYSLRKGEHTKVPVRTQFGYHIIMVVDRHPNPGSIRISHLVKRFGSGMRDSAAVRDSAWAVYRRIQSGMTFAAAVHNYSDDPQSAMRDGDLGFFDRSRLPLEIAIPLYESPLDSVTPPMRLSFGYDIFKVTARKPIPPFAEVEKDIKTTYQQQRYQRDYADFLERLKRQYHLTVDTATLSRLSHAFDTTKTVADSGWDAPLTPALRASIIFSCGDSPFTVRDFAVRVNGSADFSAIRLTPGGVEKIADRLAEMQVLEEHARRAPSRDSAFAALMKEYEEGILLYRVEQDDIWRKLVVNDSLLHIHYDSTKARYRWPNRASFAEIYMLSDSAIQAVYRMVRNGGDFVKLAHDHTMREGYREKSGIWGLQPTTTNELYGKAWNMRIDSVTAPFKYQSGWSVIKTLALDSARAKTFAEAIPELTGSYQEEAAKVRESQWLDDLRRQYPVVIFPDVLSEAFRNKRP